ncbi:MAG: purine-nucleoside phosphorylase, partial [Oscillospiraceae bacterium]|nr:purine-nucleoside phosphorylase [Oscillospiraceae bacterium]
MSKMYQRLEGALNSIRAKTDFIPRIALVLGSGLEGITAEMDVRAEISYHDIEGMPASTAPGHTGAFIFGYLDEVPMVVMKGRVHYYEGYTPAETVIGVRLMGMMGAKALILTNAAGGVNWGFEPGDLMLIRDQICMIPSPLIGENVDELGTRFPDMSEIYSKRLRDAVKKAAMESGVSLKEGVYIQLGGPNYESPSEIRMVRTMGADAVGMSTATEAIAARHMGLETVGVSCISNLACGMSNKPLTHKEVQETADRVSAAFRKLIRNSVKIMGE